MNKESNYEYGYIMDNVQIGALLMGLAGLLLTAFTYLLHSYIIQIHKRVQKIEEFLEGK